MLAGVRASYVQLSGRSSDFDSERMSFLDWWSRYTWDYVMVFEVRAEDKELTFYQRKFSMKEILTRLNAGGECHGIRILLDMYRQNGGENIQSPRLFRMLPSSGRCGRRKTLPTK